MSLFLALKGDSKKKTCRRTITLELAIRKRSKKQIPKIKQRRLRAITKQERIEKRN